MAEKEERVKTHLQRVQQDPSSKIDQRDGSLIETLVDIDQRNSSRVEKVVQVTGSCITR